MPIRANLQKNKKQNYARESGKEFRRQLAIFNQSVTDFDVTIADAMPILKEYSQVAKNVYGTNLCKSLGMKRTPKNDFTLQVGSTKVKEEKARERNLELALLNQLMEECLRELREESASVPPQENSLNVI